MLQEARPGNATQQLLFKITSDGALRCFKNPDGSIVISIIDFIKQVLKCPCGRGEWSDINKQARNPEAIFHKECASIVAGARMLI